MRRTLIAALVVSTGLGGLAYGQAIKANKVGVLSVSLNNQYQGYQVGNTFGVVTNAGGNSGKFWDDHSYQAIWRCNRSVYYKSSSKQVNNSSIIKAINAAFTRDGGLFTLTGTDLAPNPYYGGQFTTGAKIVVVNYENNLKAQPYPPTEKGLWGNAIDPDPVLGQPYWNAPWVYDPLGTRFDLSWPNLNYITWGKPNLADLGAGPEPVYDGAKVYLLDPSNAKVSLQCFDVTPFFAFDESLCYYCWDTIDRVTDGTINAGTISATGLPCDIPGAPTCKRSGSGTTKFYMTLKFNNVINPAAPVPGAPNTLLAIYYTQIRKFDPSWATAYGANLTPGRKSESENALNFTVSGLYTYKWSYKAVNGVTEAMGTMSTTAYGSGYSPMCGLFNGPVSITEKAYNDPSLKGKAVCLDAGLRPIVP